MIYDVYLSICFSILVELIDVSKLYVVPIHKICLTGVRTLRMGLLDLVYRKLVCLSASCDMVIRPMTNI